MPAMLLPLTPSCTVLLLSLVVLVVLLPAAWCCSCSFCE
jgi:hypothetical protein